MIRRTFLALTAATLFAAPLTTPAFAAGMDIVDTAVAAGNFTTLVAAVTAAGLVDTLKGPGPFTVFAPTDAAFAALLAGTVAVLLKPENKDKLTALMSNHSVGRNLKTFALIERTQDFVTLGGRMLRTTGTMAVTVTMTVNGAHLLPPDLVGSNGAVHGIDAVRLLK